MSYMQVEPFVAALTRRPRTPRLVRAKMRPSAAEEQEVLIRNISGEGVGAKASAAAPPVGTQVEIALPSGHTVTGTVRWADGQSFGIETFSAVDASAVSAWLRSQQASTRPSWEVHSRHRPYDMETGLPKRAV